MWLNSDNRYRLSRWAEQYYAVYGKTGHPRQPYVITTCKGWTPEQSARCKSSNVIKFKRQRK